MNLRDYFAAAALPALIERQEIAGAQELLDGRDREDSETNENTMSGWDEMEFWSIVAKGAYALADAMVEARKANPQTPSGDTFVEPAEGGL